MTKPVAMSLERGVLFIEDGTEVSNVSVEAIEALPEMIAVVQAMVADLEEKLVALGWASIEQYHQRAGKTEPHMRAVALLKKLNAYDAAETTNVCD